MLTDKGHIWYFYSTRIQGNFISFIAERGAQPVAGRKKLSDKEREEVMRLHKEEGQSYAALATRFDVSYNTIIRICNPDRYEQQKKKAIEYNAKNMESILRTRAQNQKQYKFYLAKSVDRDMIDHLDRTENISGYIKTLIREDMERTTSRSE